MTLILTLLTCSSLFTASAQVSVNFNVGSQPVWGPVGYNYAEYYYLPDIETYYYVPKKQFVYLKGKNWVFANSLPGSHANFDLYRGYKVVINERNPYHNHSVYYKKYYPYRGKKGQPFIRDSHEEKYWQVKEHPQHSKWKNGKGNSNGNGKGNGNKGKGGGNGKNKK